MKDIELQNEPTKVMPTLNEQKKYWDQRWEKEKTPNQWQIKQVEAIIPLIKKIPNRDLNILDLGCGTGWMTDMVKEFGHVRGIDLSETAIATAKSKYPEIEFAAENFVDSPIPRETFDVVTAKDVIAHVEDQRLFINKIAEILKPHGYLILTTINKVIIKRMTLGSEPKGHIKQWLSMRDIKRLCKDRFIILQSMTVNPLGNKGFLRLVNSYKLNKLLQKIIQEKKIEHIKECLGLGYTRVIFLQKR